mmetsp:Transcript_66733/g.168394  ORF Transcript_66733/g.168394 Transcript_66733/m.168394 type:complete len:252 (-) Transcript_66733:279-1034(-)
MLWAVLGRRAYSGKRPISRATPSARHIAADRTQHRRTKKQDLSTSEQSHRGEAGHALLQEQPKSQTLAAKPRLVDARDGSIAAEDSEPPESQMRLQSAAVKTEQLQGKAKGGLFQFMRTPSMQTSLAQSPTGADASRVLFWTGFTLNAITVALIPFDSGTCALVVNIALGTASASVATARTVVDANTDSLNAGSVVLSIAEVATSAACVGAVVGEVVGMCAAAAADVYASADNIGEACAAVAIVYDSMQQS